MNIIKQDNEVQDLNDLQQTQVEQIKNYFDCLEDVTLFETIHGHIAHITFKEGRFVPGTECDARRIDITDMKFLATVAPRWVELYNGYIKVGV